MINSKVIIKVSNILGIIITIATPVVTAYCTKKCIDKLEKEKKYKHLDKKEVIKKAAPYFIAPTLLTLSNILINVSTNRYFNKRIAALYSAALAYSTKLITQEKKTEELYGEDSIQKIKEEISKDKLRKKVINLSENDKKLFYLYDADLYFTATPFEVLFSCYELNRLFVLRGYASLNDFIDILKKYTEDEKLEPIEAYGYSIGWSQEAGSTTYGYAFIDFRISHDVDIDENLRCDIIYFPFAPTADYLEIELYGEETNPYSELK